MHTIQKKTLRRSALLAVSALITAGSTWAQQTTESSEIDEEEVIVLSPFEVSTEDDQGYAAATTLAGNRLKTDLRDIGNSVSVITSQFMQDVQATNNETLLQYTAGTEVGSVRGNFAGLGDNAVLDETGSFSNPNSNTRVRGLASADNTRDYFLSEIPWDSFNVDRVDLQRGPNSILFGLGSPAGLLNVGTKQAGFRDSNEVAFRVDNWGSARATANFNKVIIPDQLAVRVDALYDQEKFQQDPAYEDDNRIHTALRYEPGFLKKGDSRTIIKASYENGNISSNRPRSVPPGDYVTPWLQSGTYEGTYKSAGNVRIDGVQTAVNTFDPRTYNHLNGETFNPFQVQDDNTGRPNHGQNRPVINGGPDAGYHNPSYNPWIGNFAQTYGGPQLYYNPNSPTAQGPGFVYESSGRFGVAEDGSVDGDIARSFHRAIGVTDYATYAANAGLPYYQYGLYKSKNLTDPGTFDFYNNLLDGPNKNEWNDWDAINASLVQTFMNDKFGFEISYQDEYFVRGQNSMITGSHQAIYVDINKVYSDGTNAGINGEPWDDGTPNPNVGRPYISDSGQGGNNEYISEREAIRATAFFTQDFSAGGRSDSLWRRILGKHTWTGLYSEDNHETDNRQWNRYAIEDSDYFNQILGGPIRRFNDNAFAINRVIYLGDSIAGKDPSNLNLSRANAVTNVPSTVTIRAFDSHWNAPGVDQRDYWANEYYPVGHDSYDSTQSDNPANYVGFRNIDVNVTDANSSKAARNHLTTAAQLSRDEVESQAFVWQAYFWDKSIVGNWGYREDTATAYGLSKNTNSVPEPGYLDFSDYELPNTPTNVVEATSRSYSIVGHINDLPFLSGLMEDFPVELTFFYNNSSNFQPSASRVDTYGIPLAPPAGETIDRGILIESKDRRYSLKINKYVTKLTNATSGSLGNSWFIGASQAWAGNWANKFEYDLTGDTIDTQTNNRPAGAPNPPGYTDIDRPGNPDYDPSNGLFNYNADVGETEEQALAREDAAVAGWRAWQAQVDPRFYAAWGINLNDPASAVSASQPQGFTITEDSQSEGYEIEFTANPTRNWRITANLTQTKASRSNVGGESLKEFITAYESALRNTAAGDLRIWWGGAGNDTTLRQWFQSSDQVGADWAQKQLAEGTSVPELREWRFNAITNYNFTEGRLKGFRVGGGVRWQDEVGIGYRPLGDPNSDTIDLDIANPYMGDAEMNIDLWFGYHRKLSEKVEWDIQVNITNVGKGNDLIPVTVQPDGSPATYRIAPRQYWTISNSFSF